MDTNGKLATYIRTSGARIAHSTCVIETEKNVYTIETAPNGYTVTDKTGAVTTLATLDAVVLRICRAGDTFTGNMSFLPHKA